MTVEVYITLSSFPSPKYIYMYMYKICVYFTYLKYICTHICTYIPVCLLKLALEEGDKGQGTSGWRLLNLSVDHGH